MASLTVATTQGVLQGKLSTAITGETARAFLAVPYVRPSQLSAPPGDCTQMSSRS